MPPQVWHFVDASDEPECNHVPGKPTVLAALQFRKSLAVSSAISHICCCLYLTEIKLHCFVVLAEVTVYCYGWRLLSSWKQMAILHRNVFRPSSRCYQHREAVCSMFAIQCFAQAYNHYVFSSAVSIQGHSQLDPKFIFALDTAIS